MESDLYDENQSISFSLRHFFSGDLIIMQHLYSRVQTAQVRNMEGAQSVHVLLLKYLDFIITPYGFLLESSACCFSLVRT